MAASDPARDFRSAYAHHRAGNLDKAEALYTRVLKKVPDQPDALNMLGLIALSRADPQRAVTLISKAVRRAPQFADAHSNLGNALLAAGKPREAIESYRRAIALAPGNPDAKYNLSVALRRAGETAEAEAVIRAALALNPAALDWRRDLAILLIETDRPADALVTLKALVQQRPDNAQDALAYATALYRSGDITAAVEAFRRAVGLAPNDAEAWNSLGLTLRALGRFDDAEVMFRRAADLQPDHSESLRNLGLIGRLNGEEGQKGLSIRIAQKDAPVLDRIAAGFTLGKLLDEAGRYDEAFEHYRAANETFLRHSSQRYDAAALTASVDRAISEPLHNPFGSDCDMPVFIVGMPRSGTSLVEQIAASHPQVHGAGELRDMGRIASAASQEAALAAHLDRLQQLGAARVIDKMPDNIFLLGRIVAWYPHARVVFCRRDRRDTALSCYFTLFASGNLFSYELTDCAHRIRETERLADHWRRNLPLRMLTVDYEDLVADLEGQSRRLIAFLGLDWDAACLKFHETNRAVATASSWQVRQPLYASSVGRWHHYAGHLDGLVFE